MSSVAGTLSQVSDLLLASLFASCSSWEPGGSDEESAGST